MPSLIQTNIKRTFQINMHHVYRLQFEGFGTRDNFLSGIQQFFCISSSGCSCTNEWKHQLWLLLHIQYIINIVGKLENDTWQILCHLPYMWYRFWHVVFIIYMYLNSESWYLFHVKKKLQIFYPNHIRTTYFWCSNVLRRHLYWNDQIMMS